MNGPRRRARLPWHRPGTRRAAAVVLSVAIGLLAAVGHDRGTFGRYETAATDVLFPTGPTYRDVVVVGVDEASVAEVGAWPWPRDVQAALLDRLREAGADVVVYDALVAPTAEGDADLAAAARRFDPGRLVLASLPLDVRADGSGLLEAAAVVDPVPVVEAAGVVGHTLVAADADDGVARSVPLVVGTPDGSLRPALSLQAYTAAERLDPTPVLRPDGVQVGDQLVPTERGWRLRVSWPADLVRPDGPRVLPAAAVLRGEVDRLRGSIVLVGTTDPTLGDHHDTPLRRIGGTAGILVHAAALNTMLTGAYLDTAGSAAAGLAAAAVALLPALAFQLRRSWLGLVVTALTAVGFLAAVTAWFASGTIVPVVWPMLGLAAGAGGGLAIRYFGEVRARQRVTRLFGRYLPPDAAAELLSAGRIAEVMAGQRLEIGVLFCDLRGFTPLSRQLEPEQLRDLLNTYYEWAVAVIERHRGTVLQYVGDEVFAAFGAPVPMEGGPAAAVACALELQTDRPSLVAQLSAGGLPPITYGIGVHTGPVVAAHVGTAHRQYTVLGDTVNVASRLCSQAAADEVVLSDALAEASGGTVPGAVREGPIPLKGVEGGVVVWRVRPGDRAGDPAGSVPCPPR